MRLELHSIQGTHLQDTLRNEQQGMVIVCLMQPQYGWWEMSHLVKLYGYVLQENYSFSQITTCEP